MSHDETDSVGAAYAESVRAEAAGWAGELPEAQEWAEVVDLRAGEQHRGQLRMAYRLAAAQSGALMFVHGIGWHCWDGTRWVEDRHGVAKRAVYAVLRDALAESIDDKELRGDVARCESAAGVSGVLDLAAGMVQFAFTVEDLDADPYLLNTAAGTLDLRVGKVREHDPADRITKVTTGAYRPHDDVVPGESDWTSFLTRVLPDPEVRGFLARLAGVALLGVVREQVLAIATGTGANGKSVFCTALGHALGDYAMTCDPELFLHRDGAHPTGEMDLRGIRWAVVSESDQGRRLAEATVKRLTGGDVIKARRMRENFVEFTPSHTPLLVTNHLPKVRGDDPALWRRLRVIPFEVVIPEGERDPRLAERLEVAADEVLSWAVAGYVDYVARGGLEEPERVTGATDAYQRDADAVARFLEECTYRSTHAHVVMAELWESWCLWRADDGAEELTKRQFGEALDRHGITSRRGAKGVRYRDGAVLLNTEEDQ